MNLTRNFTGAFSLLCVLAATVFFSTSAIGQGRYTTRYNKNNVGTIITRLEKSSNEFRRDFDRAMDRSRLNGTAEENRLNGIVDEFEDSVDRLRSEFNRNNSWWDSRAEVERMISAAYPVNDLMNNAEFQQNLERRWSQLRNDVNSVADTYDLPGLNGGGWNGGAWNGNQPWNPNGQGNVPNWALGTFYGRNPQTGGTITLNISKNGSVNISFDGNAPIYASMDRTTLRNGQYLSRVTRLNNGIRTTETSSGEVIDYYRNQSDGNWNNGNTGWNNNSGNVPDWAVGTFYGRNPQTGGTITMTVAKNGSVNIAFDNNAPIYARMDSTTLRNGQYTSRVSRLNNGIRTTETSSGEVIDYYRNQNDGNWNNGNTGWNNNSGNVPDWAVGTFYGRNPQTGGTITLNISKNGSVSIAFDNNAPIFASMDNTTLRNGQYTSRVSRLNNGIRTTETRSGEVIDYYRR